MYVAEKERMPRLSLGEEKNMVTQLLVLNITAFILLYFISIIYQMENIGLAAFDRDILRNIQVPAAAQSLLYKPWTLITAPFAHIGFWDIISNGIWMFCFGTLLQNISGHRLVVPLYLFGSLAGSAFYVAGMNLIPAFRPLIATHGIMGAGAGVMALAVGVTVLAPKTRVFPLLMSGGVPIWVFSVIYFALSVASIVSVAGAQSTLLYLAGGAFIGYMFIAQFKKGHNWGTGLNKVLFYISHLFHPKSQKDLAAAAELVDTPAYRSRSNSPAPFTRVGASVSEQKLNEILDKINDLGMNSLTAEEKETLLRASREKIE